MNESPQKLFPRILRQMLRPLARILLRHGIPHRTFAECAKQAYVDVAVNEFAVPDRKPTISRVAVLTGLTRKDVSRVLREEPAPTNLAEHTNRAARVISKWVRTPAFNDRAGRPRALAADGPDGFAELVQRSRVDVPPRALLDELLRVGAVASTRDGRYRLVTRAYVPHSTEADKIELLGAEVADLVASFDHNLTHSARDAFFQRAVRYDNLTVECLPDLRRKGFASAQTLLEKLDRFMARNDRDVHPDLEAEGRARAVLGIYYYEEPFEEES